MILGLENIDPHYKIIAFVKILPKMPQPIIPIVKNIKILISFCETKQHIQVVIASQNGWNDS
jgi:hypothetical protein